MGRVIIRNKTNIKNYNICHDFICRNMYGHENKESLYKGLHLNDLVSHTHKR